MNKSSNCNTYTDSISVLVATPVATVSGGDERCSARLDPTFSCQTSNFEAIDDVTRTDLRDAACPLLRDQGCPVLSDCGDADKAKIAIEGSTNFVGALEREYSASKLVALGLASNCFREGNDPNHATHIGNAVCRPQYDMIVDGKTVRNYNMEFRSSLATCDISDEAEAQLFEDLRKVAKYNAGQNGYGIRNATDLACSYSILPGI